MAMQPKPASQKAANIVEARLSAIRFFKRSLSWSRIQSITCAKISRLFFLSKAMLWSLLAQLVTRWETTEYELLGHEWF